jgi:hypothetical protein
MVPLLVAALVTLVKVTPVKVYLMIVVWGWVS